MTKLLLSGAATAAILAGSAAFAATTQVPQTGTQVAAPRAHPAQHRKIQPATRAEVQSRVATMFAKLDTNHDGAITKEELSARDAQREQRLEQRAAKFDPSKIFDRIDANHDGKITVAEAEAAHSQRMQAKGGKPAEAHATAFGGFFARADANKDGVITRAEFDTVGQQMKARMEHAGMARGGMETRMFDTADGNKDGRITLAEMQQAALARFDTFDLNHDGTISPEERQQARQSFKAQRKPQ